jgi:GTP pyrophosphokinase
MKNLDTYSPMTKDNLSKLLIAIGHDIRVIIIKLADRLHNLLTLNFLPPDKQVRIAKESLEVFGPMADRLGMGQVRMQIEELAFSYINHIEFKKLKILMKKKLGKSTRELGKIKVEVENALNKQNLNSEINGRVKSIYSLYLKLKKVNNNIDDIYDLMALRVLVDKKEDCYLALGIIHSMYRPMINRIKDYIASPKPNGYQSIHTTVITPSKQIVEFQIRTHEMHEYDERGLAASFHYHAQKSQKDYIQKQKSSTLPGNMQWIAQLQEVVEKLKNGEEISKNQLNIDLFSNRIFVHSPKGDIFNLPENALPLDFAYLVHSDIAEHAYSFRVNGKIHPFNKPLQNGDIVEVVTRKNSQPKIDWHEMIITTHAHNKLNNQLRKLGIIEPKKHKK